MPSFIGVNVRLITVYLQVIFPATSKCALIIAFRNLLTLHFLNIILMKSEFSLFFRIIAKLDFQDINGNIFLRYKSMISDNFLSLPRKVLWDRFGDN